MGEDAYVDAYVRAIRMLRLVRSGPVEPIPNVRRLNTEITALLGAEALERVKVRAWSRLAGLVDAPGPTGPRPRRPPRLRLARALDEAYPDPGEPPAPRQRRPTRYRLARALREAYANPLPDGSPGPAPDGWTFREDSRDGTKVWRSRRPRRLSLERALREAYPIKPWYSSPDGRL
jgi:hypothetical protein